MTCLAVLLLASSATAADGLKSGPQVGAANDRSGFYPQWVAGPGAGERRCPV
jgi:hypothetical protein